MSSKTPIIDDADADLRRPYVILLRADGPAFTRAVYNLDWGTGLRVGEPARRNARGKSSVTDYNAMSRFVNVYMKLWYATKPTIMA